MGNIFGAVCLVDQAIFNAHTEFAGHIDTGFRGSHAVFHHNIFAVTAAIGLFVDLQTYTVAIAVAKILP